MTTPDPSLYVLNFTRPVYQNHYGIKCRLPTPAADKECVNFGLPQDKQKFKRVEIPDDLWDWQFMGDAKKQEMEQFIANEYHKRKNGVWIFIKGVKMYIPGVMYFYLNYWNMSTGGLPTFRVCDLHFFLVWFHCCLDPKCYGLVDFKPRQIGDTEKALCIIYEYGTRVRNVRCGMQSNTGDDIKAKFTDRMILAHDMMVWFMKPINQGSTNPKEGLMLDYPALQNTNKAIEERVKKGETVTISADTKYLYKPIRSKIDWKASVPKAYNGLRMHRYYLDEFGMMEEMDPNEAWYLVKQAQKDRNTDEICGKAIMTANVDEVGKDKTGEEFSKISMEYAYQLFEESNQDELDENGETVSGLYRILRTWKDNCPCDAWGFPMIEKAALKRKNTIDGLIKKRKIKALYQYRRQNPETWDDVFLSTGEGSGMDVERLLAREQFLKESFDGLGNRKKPLYFRADLEWKDNIFNWQDPYWIPEVILRPNLEGDYWFSHTGLPKNHGCVENSTVYEGFRRPGNIDVFCMAADPYDEKDAVSRNPSLGGLCARVLYNHDIDGEKVCKKEGDLQDNLKLGDPLDYGSDWMTDKYSAAYLKREQDPMRYYEAGLKLAIYLGTDCLIERQKGGAMIVAWEMWGFGSYVQERPEYSKPDVAKGTEQQGVYMVEGMKELLMKKLKTESVIRANTIDIPVICEQVATLNWKNMTKKDLATAAGLSHIAAMRNVRQRQREKKEERDQQTQSFEEYSV